MRRALFPLAAISLATALHGGCSGDEQVAPVVDESGSGGGSSSSSSSTATATASTGAGTPVRDVFVRNPFGEQDGNLLSDGDFELSITSNPGQQGWNFFGYNGSDTLVAETGGLCRSGLRCGVFPKGGALLARATAAPDMAPMVGEIWVKPLDGSSCNGVTVYVVGCDDFAVRGQFGGLVPQMEDDGWCALRGTAAASATAVCMYLENEGTGMLIDAASLRAAEPDAARRVSILPVPAATRARMDAVRDHLRTLPISAPRRALDLDPTP
jgi:hypothetical protein